MMITSRKYGCTVNDKFFILITFYLQLIVLLFGTLSGKFVRPKGRSCAPDRLLVLDVILSSILPSTVRALRSEYRILAKE